MVIVPNTGIQLKLDGEKVNLYEQENTNENQRIMNRYVLLGLFWFWQDTSVFFQLNGQFKWEWFKENTFLLALFGIPISYFYIWGTKYAVEVLMDCMPQDSQDLVWVWLCTQSWLKFFNEGITPKIKVSLVLATLLLGVQVLWK